MAVGQVIVRKVGNHSDGTPLLVVCGIIPDPGVFETDHQYTVIVSPEGNLTFVPGTGVDMEEQLRGTTPTYWLMEPIWRHG